MYQVPVLNLESLPGRILAGCEILRNTLEIFGRLL